MSLTNELLKVGRGDLLAVIGPVGSGKSSLLQVTSLSRKTFPGDYGRAPDKQR